MDGWMHAWMDGRMTCDFASYSTVFQSYQDDGQMKGCVQWKLHLDRVDFAWSRARIQDRYFEREKPCLIIK